MPISSKTPSTEIASKSASSSRTGDRAGTDKASQPVVPRHPQDAIFFTTDLEGTVTSCSQSADRYGAAPADVIGQSIAGFYNIDQLTFGSRMMAAIRDEGHFEGEFRCRSKAGQQVQVRLCLVLLRDSNATPNGIVGFSTELAAEKVSETIRSASIQSATNDTVPPARREIDGTQFLVASPIMHKFMGMVDRVAGHTETVLVTGETGTGKELVARTIHESSYRRKHALVDINCAALPEHLVESELFGYEKGAFSGADSSKPGLFELADKSTIFLDEIGELQPQIQVKLLRVLDGAPYYRLGGNRKIVVDVRVVAATNQDLELAVKEGRFRKDLFHRLCQFQLRVPPLRERPEDIAALAAYFLSLKAADKFFTTDALGVLKAYTWPGNIRELRNLVAKLAMATDGSQIAAEEVAAQLGGEPAVASQSSHTLPLGNLDNMEEQMIIRALEQTGGHRAHAAERLGISRRTLSRKLKEYDIDTPPGEGDARLGTISQEQQKFFRAKVNLPVTLKNARGKELHVQAVNLSTGGMGLDAVSDAAGFGALIDVSFLLPESETEMHAKGRLMWADGGGRAGLRFVVIEPALFEQLHHWTNRKMKDEGWEIPS